MPIKITQKLGNKKKQFNVLTKEELSELFGGNIARAGEVIGRTAELNNKLDQVSDNVNTAVEESFQEAGFFYNDTINEVTDALNRSIQEGGNELSYNDVESSQANGLLVTGYDRTTDPDTPISRINLRGDGTTSDGVSFAGIHIQKFDTDSNIWETNFWANSAGDLFMNGNLQLAEGSILVGTRDDFENGRAGVFIDPDLGVVVQGDTNVANVARVILSGEGTDEDQNAYSGINIQGWDDEDNKWVSNFYADPDGNIFLRGRIEATEGFLGDLEVQGMLQSSNYQETTEEEGGDGFRIEGSTGDAYFNRIFVRGEDPDNRYLRGSLIDGDALGWDGSKLNIRFGNNVSYDDVNDKIDADPTNLGYTDQFNDGIEITSTTGSNVTIPLANASTGGFMGTNDWQKLDGIDEDADNYSHWRITGDDTGTGSVGSGQTVTFSGSKLTSVTRSGVAMTIESSWNIGDGGDQPTEVDGSQNVNFTGRENSTTQEIYIDTELSGQSVLFDLNLGSLDNRFLQELTYITDSSDPLAPVKISISDGNEITLQEASSNNAGLLSASDYDFIQDLETDISDLQDAKVIGVSFNSNVRGLTINQDGGSESTTLSNVAMENRENTFQDHQNFDTSISVNTASTTYDVNVGGTVNASNLRLNGTLFHQRAYTWTDTQTFEGGVSGISASDVGAVPDNLSTSEWQTETGFDSVYAQLGEDVNFADGVFQKGNSQTTIQDDTANIITVSSSRIRWAWYNTDAEVGIRLEHYESSNAFRFQSATSTGGWGEESFLDISSTEINSFGVPYKMSGTTVIDSNQRIYYQGEDLEDKFDNYEWFTAQTDSAVGTQITSKGTLEFKGTNIDIQYNGNGQFEFIGESGGVSSVFGRQGTVTAESGDYSIGQISGGTSSSNITWTGSHDFRNELTASDTSINFTSRGQIAIGRGNSSPFLSFHNSDGSRKGFIQTTENEFRFFNTGSDGVFSFENGKVAIGRRNPEDSLHVITSGTGGILLSGVENNDHTWIEIQGGGSGGSDVRNAGIRLFQAGVERWRNGAKGSNPGAYELEAQEGEAVHTFCQNGKVGFNTTSPDAYPDLAGGCVRVLSSPANRPSTGAGFEMEHLSSDNRTVLRSYDRDTGNYTNLFIRADNIHLGTDLGNDIVVLKSNGDVEFEGAVEPQGGLILPDQPAT